MASDFAPGFTFDGFGGGQEEAQAPWEFGGESGTSFRNLQRAPQHATRHAAPRTTLGFRELLTKVSTLHAVRRCREQLTWLLTAAAAALAERLNAGNC